MVDDAVGELLAVDLVLVATDPAAAREPAENGAVEAMDSRLCAEARFKKQKQIQCHLPQEDATPVEVVARVLAGVQSLQDVRGRVDALLRQAHVDAALTAS